MLFQTADQLTHAYKYGSFEKVHEFLNFREKLKNSFHYSLVTIEHLINDLIHLPSHEVTVQVMIRLLYCFLHRIIRKRNRIHIFI